MTGSHPAITISPFAAAAYGGSFPGHRHCARGHRPGGGSRETVLVNFTGRDQEPVARPLSSSRPPNGPNLFMEMSPSIEPTPRTDARQVPEGPVILDDEVDLRAASDGRLERPRVATARPPDHARLVNVKTKTKNSVPSRPCRVVASPVQSRLGMSVRVLALAGLGLAAAMSSGMSASEPREVGWADASAFDLDKVPIRSVDRGIAEHARERRGFVPVPLDYARPAEREIEIFYRLLPSQRSATDADAPILVVMNGGPGVPSSAYRALDYDYEAGAQDAFSELSRYFRVLAVDQRGTGNSAPLDLDDPGLPAPVVARYFDSDEHALDHARVIEAVIPASERFFILARSYGGEIGFQYLTLGPGLRAPSGFVFDSAVLPHTDPLETFLLRREKQRKLNHELRSSVPGIVEALARLRAHLESLRMEAANINFLWSYLGKGPGWAQELERRIQARLEIGTRQEMEAQLGSDIRGSVNLLNYVLSSASLTPGYTDRTMTLETSRRVPFESWMLDENWTLNQVGNDGGWRGELIAAVDRRPPPAVALPSVEAIRRALSDKQILFVFGRSDAFLPHGLQLERARRFHVPGHTEFRVFDAGHGAAFSAEGASFVAQWASRILASAAPDFDFAGLLADVAAGWSTNDAELALSVFTEDAVYMEPPNLHFFRGRAELRRFFEAVNPGSTMIWHRLWFDESSGIGAGEYSFHNGGRDTAAHGVAVLELRGGKIAVWREYQQRGEIDYQEFLRTDGKRWKWTVDALE